MVLVVEVDVDEVDVEVVGLDDVDVVDTTVVVRLVDVVGIKVLLDLAVEDVGADFGVTTAVVGMMAVDVLRGAEDFVVGCCVTAVDAEEIGRDDEDVGPFVALDVVGVDWANDDVDVGATVGLLLPFVVFLVVALVPLLIVVLVPLHIPLMTWKEEIVKKVFDLVVSFGT